LLARLIIPVFSTRRLAKDYELKVQRSETLIECATIRLPL
jgi:hypothetical protein